MIIYQNHNYFLLYKNYIHIGEYIDLILLDYNNISYKKIDLFIFIILIYLLI